MLYEFAIGDAYGAGFEMAPAEFVVTYNNPELGYVKHPTHNIKPGAYTDDTQMSLGLAEWLLSKELKTSVQLARSFVSAFKRDPREGYAAFFYDLLCKVENGTQMLQQIVPGSKRSGGAMRATPCGLCKTLEEAINLAMFQASLTHATQSGMASAAAVAALVWYCRNTKKPNLAKLPTFLQKHLPQVDWKAPVQTTIPNDGVQVVLAVLQVLSDSASMEEVLKNSVAFTGDVDTVAAIAMAVASFCHSIQQDIPEVLVDGIEDGAFGSAYLKKLDRDLEKAFPV